MGLQKIQKRNQVIKAAARVFARNGYSNAVIADIAIAAKIGKGTVYEYFDSKEDLFFAVFEWFQKKTEKAATDRLNVSGLIQLGIESGEFCPDVKPEPIAAALVGTWDALFLQAWFDDDFDPGATARDFLETVIRGLSKKA
jgi:AcrR family transcriptional regulator